MARLLNREHDNLAQYLPSTKEPWTYTVLSNQDTSGYAGYFRDEGEVRRFLSAVRGSAAL
jgi:hypothetical protein